jgi:hypothetical protein
MTKQNKPKRDEKGLDEALDQSFPASDPPSQTNPSQSTRTDAERLNEHKRQKP